MARATNPSARQEDIGSYDIFDLSASYRINQMLEVRGGVENLFDREPNIFGRIPGVTNAIGDPEPGGTFDVIGRRFYLGVKADF